MQFTSNGFRKIANVLNAMHDMRDSGWNNDPNSLGALGIGNEPNKQHGYRPYHTPYIYAAWLPMRPIVHAALWKLITDQVASFCDGMFWPWPWFAIGEMARFNNVWGQTRAGSTLWNQRLRTMYWYTDYDGGDWWKQTLDAPGGNLQGSPKAGVAIRDAAAP